ncbi:MAG TPA: hypothetical protein VG457_17640, partial [Planctomycetota bacterium]|jgi:hypothetical protein|nr:hypothetical protein [Planctomycetota bacterium]
VHIISGKKPSTLLAEVFTETGSGTMIHRNLLPPKGRGRKKAAAAAAATATAPAGSPARPPEEKPAAAPESTPTR